MKKFFVFLMTGMLVLSTLCAAPKYKENSDGSISITSVDKDPSVKANRKVDGFKNVIAIDGKKIKKVNPVTVDLSDFANKEILVKLNCEIKIEDKSAKENEIIWIINDMEAGVPTLVQKKVPTGEWTKLSGEAAVPLGENKSLYISASGLSLADMTIYLKDFEVSIAGDGIGSAEAVPVSWLDAPKLKDAYKDDFEFGLAVTLNGCLNTADVMQGLERHVTSVTMGNEFKPDFLFNWAKPSDFVDFVAEDGKTYKVPGNVPIFRNMDTCMNIVKGIGAKLRGHVLVWHSQTPHWFFTKDFTNNKDAELVDAATMNARQEWYIKTVLNHVDEWEKTKNRGKHIIYAWDVVNEAVADGAGSQKWLREDSDWFRVYGNDEFIVNAFRYANKYAPKDVLLVYNDYSCYSPQKRNAICNLIDRIKAVPDARIDAIGMQAHVKMTTPVTGFNSFEDAVKAFTEKGVDVQVTELDIANGKNKYSSIMLKAKYKEYFKMFLANKKTEEKHGISGVTIWGLTDNGTWLDNQAEYKGFKQYPLLLNADWSVKPAFYGVLEAAENQQ
ncbi:MAG: endo-1,4-beta-xylanase [Treponema sp.]|nr:endo-1,4-beta-xylanase [Treponema sp.]